MCVCVCVFIHHSCSELLCYFSLTCAHCRPRPTPNHKLVLHSSNLIYVSTIKRHGLHRSAVTFLYSHRHSWRTAGWSGERFMARARPGSLKLWQAPLPPLPRSLHCPAHLSSSPAVQPQRGDGEPGRPIGCLSQSRASSHIRSVQLPVGDMRTWTPLTPCGGVL